MGPNRRGNKSMKPLRERIADFWCQAMHTEIMWPSHGHYDCLTCGRRYRVCWEEPPRLSPRATLWPLDCLPVTELAK